MSFETQKLGQSTSDGIILKLSYLSEATEDALPRLDVCGSGLDWVDTFRALLLRSGLESVCDKSLCDPWDPEACNEFWEPNLPFRTGIDGTAKPLWPLACDWFDFLKLSNWLFQELMRERERHLLCFELIRTLREVVTYLVTLDGGAKTPWLGLQSKYLTPATEPSFFPTAWSSSIPSHKLEKKKKIEKWSDGLSLLVGNLTGSSRRNFDKFEASRNVLKGSLIYFVDHCDQTIFGVIFWRSLQIFGNDILVVFEDIRQLTWIL